MDMESTPLNSTLSSATMSNLDRAAMAATSDMVGVLFGVSGSCWGSFACSYQRIPGRLYATTKSVLFYSNMMGFERRICLDFTDIQSMILHRTTSIRIELVTDEVYVLKSFEDREQVLQMMEALKRLEFKEFRRLRSADDTLSGGMLTDDERSYDSDCNNSIHDSIRSLQLPRAHSRSPIRQRASSDSVIRTLGFEEGDTETPGAETPNGSASPVTEAAIKPDWEELKHNIKNLEHIGVDREDIQDKDVVVTPWYGESGDFVREISFRHQIKSSFGPAEAMTTRKQRMRRFETKGITLENCTTVANTPASDAFMVQDHWVIQNDGDDHVILTVYFAPRFVKRTMLRGLIERSVKQETMGWLKSYVEKVKTVLEAGTLAARHPVATTSTAEDLSLALATMMQSLRPWFVAITMLLTAILIVLVLHLGIVWQSLRQQNNAGLSPQNLWQEL